MPHVKRSRRSALDGSLIAFVDHVELHDRRVRERLIRLARELLAQQTLTSENELTLFKALQACGYLLSRTCAKRFTTRPALRRIADMHKRIRDRLVEQNIGLVYEMRRRTRVVDVDADELTSEAFWALFQAVTRFDPWRGFRFSTYACTSMLHGALLLAKKNRRQRDQLRRLQETVEESEPGAGDDQDLERSVLVERLRTVLTTNRAGLTPAERFIVERRLLQEGVARSETLESIGGFFNLSKERIRQIQLSAMDKLRLALRNSGNVSNGTTGHPGGYDSLSPALANRRDSYDNELDRNRDRDTRTRQLGPRVSRSPHKERPLAAGRTGGLAA